MRREARVGIARAGLHAAVDGVIEQRGAEHVQRGFRLRLVEVLTLTGASPIVERGQQRGRGKARHDVIGVGAEGPMQRRERISPLRALFETFGRCAFLSTRQGKETRCCGGSAGHGEQRKGLKDDRGNSDAGCCKRRYRSSVGKAIRQAKLLPSGTDFVRGFQDRILNVAHIITQPVSCASVLTVFVV